MQRAITFLARLMAYLGGAVLCALILLTCASVLGRGLNTAFHGPLGAIAPGFAEWALAMGVGPINGDFEVVEAGVAFAIFAFLPWCQLTAGHAVVDVFTTGLSAQTNRVLRALAEVVFAAVLVLIAVQLSAGTLSKYGYGETTFLLQFPVWWGYAASLCAAIVAALTGIYVACYRVAEAVSKRDLLPNIEDAA